MTIQFYYFSLSIQHIKLKIDVKFLNKSLMIFFTIYFPIKTDQKRHDLATPLWIAAQLGHDHIVKTLLQHGAFVDTIRIDGATPLFKASHKGHAHVVHELLKYKPKLGLLPVIINRKTLSTS